MTVAVTVPLISALGVSLDVPVITPAERSILINPRQLLIDLYLSRTQRGVATLLNDISFNLEPG